MARDAGNQPTSVWPREDAQPTVLLGRPPPPSELRVSTRVTGNVDSVSPPHPKAPSLPQLVEAVSPTRPPALGVRLGLACALSPRPQHGGLDRLTLKGNTGRQAPRDLSRNPLDRYEAFSWQADPKLQPPAQSQAGSWLTCEQQSLGCVHSCPPRLPRLQAPLPTPSFCHTPPT